MDASTYFLAGAAIGTAFGFVLYGLFGQLDKTYKEHFNDELQQTEDPDYQALLDKYQVPAFLRKQSE